MITVKNTIIVLIVLVVLKQAINISFKDNIISYRRLRNDRNFSAFSV